MAHTKYANFSDDELLNEVDAKRQYSPILEELCCRLEKKALDLRDTNHKVECPVCEASLIADLDTENNMFEIKTDKTT